MTSPHPNLDEIIVKSLKFEKIRFLTNSKWDISFRSQKIYFYHFVKYLIGSISPTLLIYTNLCYPNYKIELNHVKIVIQTII